MKSTIQKYGWIVVTVLILAVLIGIAGPAANYIKNNFAGVTDGLGDIMESGQDYTLPYTVKLKSNIEGAGTVEFTGEHSGTELDLRGNQTLTFKATANSGFRFLGWYVGGNLISEELEYTAGYSVNASVTITAEFEAYLAPGLYQTGTKTIIMSWDELISNKILKSSGQITSGQAVNLAGDLVIPDANTSIPLYAYNGCKNLTSITIPGGVRIGQYAFNGCTNLKTVYYKGTLEQWCQTEINNPQTNPCYNGAALYIDGELVTDITIPSTITSINGYAFQGCTSLTNVAIPDGVTSIGGFAFNGCKSLASINIPDSVTSIGGNAFDACKSLTSINIPHSVISIGDSAFRGCTSLTNVEIPDSVTSIGSFAFEGCTNLASITIPDSVTSIGDSAFQSCSKLNTVYYEGTLEQWCSFNFPDWTSNPCAANKANLYINNELVTNIVIPDTITEIKNYAFYGCKSLTNIEIPDSVTSIGNSAFGYTSLTNIEIPDSVTSVGKSAFTWCTDLETITFQTTNPPTFGTEAFFRSTVATIYVPAGSENAYKSALSDTYHSAKIQAIPTT